MSEMNSPAPSRGRHSILLADDHQMFREGLRQMLERQDDLEVIADVPDGRTAVRLALEHRPDVVVMDVTMPGLNGVEATRQIKSADPRIRVVALSMHADRQFVIESVSAGASAYLLKDSPVRELVEAIRAVVSGEVYLSPKVAGMVLQTASEADGTRKHFNALSPREREVLQLVTDGHSSKEIARILGLSPKTVDTHRRQVMEKLSIDSVARLTHYAIREGVTALQCR